MKASRSLLLIFIIPVLIMVLVAIGIGYWSLNSLKARYDHHAQLQDNDLKIVQQAADFSRRASYIHQRVSSAIRSAMSGELDEVQLYFMHSDIVNEFAELTEQVQALVTSELLKEVNHGSVKELHKQYEDYRRFIIMATDIIAIDPAVATDYVTLAQHHFIQFSLYTQRITKLLAERSEVRIKNDRETLDEFFLSVISTGLALLVLMLLLSVFSASLVSRKMLYVADALSLLAHNDQASLHLPEIEKMHQNSNGEFGRIAGALLGFRDAIAKRKQAEAQAFQLSFYDPLTQLPNRRLLLERLKHTLSVSAKTGQYGAVVYFDLDHFKTLNDTQGHSVGDLLLIEVSKRVQTLMAEGDTFARIGGDEFIVLLESLGQQSRKAGALAESLSEAIRQKVSEPFQFGDMAYFSSPSIGVVLFQGMDTPLDDLLKHADTAMYAAKKKGRNTISFYDPEMQALVEKRAEMESELRVAIDKKQFELYYQKQVHLQRGIKGVEALIRWIHPVKGLIPPLEFISLAEETGLIVPIGNWVLDRACHQLSIWQTEPDYANLTISVNVSAKQFKEKDFVQQVKNALIKYDVKAENLKIELTESTILEDIQETTRKMKLLRKLGVHFSLDDFGTGYSSLQYLKRLPLDQIKIDQSFVRDIVDDTEDAAIVQTIIAMGRALGLSVIAEGVENETQRALLEKLGCRCYQGYLYGKPQPIDLLAS